MQKKTVSNRTRKLNPKLGFLGILGFAGFLGFWAYQLHGDFFPFLFFGFFGFFGFFFEGKMSNTLKDERYVENRTKAQFYAYRVGTSLSIIALVTSICSGLFHSNDSKLIFLIIALSLSYACVIFLTEYLLYRYDSQDNDGEL